MVKRRTPNMENSFFGVNTDEFTLSFSDEAIAPTGLRVIGSRVTSDDDSSENGTVWLAPAPAFFQEGILEILNRNAIHPAEPGVIFTGNFVFAGDGRNSTDGEDGGRLPFPSDIAELLLRFYDGG
jgi:hypothetical protein